MRDVSRLVGIGGDDAAHAGTACKAPAKPAGRCCMHGEGHGMWRHGLRSIEEIERRRKMTAEIRRIRHEMRELGRG
jgi:hypothetical protein